ncbi:AraC-like DNA-binding protein [Yoonia maritima]|uniref:AraC-like DNA-binding protein n=1 Tax=Yoonia maritima TaxID=1435347 RepID=A0A2T0VXE9_9RHOB|nr:AraC family transcriptional regulator [Yoonia maritima]PRY76678.1 AraC-like DNA-binding protein [Yoonia maritima]
MIFFPLPFLTAFFLIYILLHLSRYVGRGLPTLVLITIAAYALQSVLLGLHWGLGTIPPNVIISFANILPPLTWLALNQMAGRIDYKKRLLVVAGIVLLLVALNTAFALGYTSQLDLIAIANYTIFGAHLMWLGSRRDLDWFSSRPLNAILPIQRAFLIAATLLIISACVDALVMADIQMNDSQISSALIGYSNLTLLVILSFVFLRSGTNTSFKATSARVVAPVSDDQISAQDILDRLDAEMSENHLYRSESLTLDQIARRIRIPYRQVSVAVNSVRAMNIPQYVNSFRIQDACRILEETDTPVTEIVFEVGFTTKSNFNREFHRVTGFTPSAWRARARSRNVPQRAPQATGKSGKKNHFHSDQTA